MRVRLKKPYLIFCRMARILIKLRYEDPGAILKMCWVGTEWCHWNFAVKSLWNRYGSCGFRARSFDGRDKQHCSNNQPKLPEWANNLRSVHTGDSGNEDILHKTTSASLPNITRQSPVVSSEASYRWVEHCVEY
jgi:hypothetical protein